MSNETFRPLALVTSIADIFGDVLRPRWNFFRRESIHGHIGRFMYGKTLYDDSGDRFEQQKTDVITAGSLLSTV